VTGHSAGYAASNGLVKQTANEISAACYAMEFHTVTNWSKPVAKRTP